jgi:hypothetical protein
MLWDAICMQALVTLGEHQGSFRLAPRATYSTCAAGNDRGRLDEAGLQQWNEGQKDAGRIASR